MQDLAPNLLLFSDFVLGIRVLTLIITDFKQILIMEDIKHHADTITLPTQ